MSELWDLVEKLKPWPPLQIGLVFIIVTFSAITYWHVLKTKWGQPSTTATRPEVEAMLTFSGPFSAINARLDTLAANQNLNKAEMREAFSEALQGTRHHIIGKMADVQAELKEDIERVKDELREGVEHTKLELRGEVAGARRELRELKVVADSINALSIRADARHRR